MAKAATAEQQARARTREWRTRRAAEQAAQDRRISGAVAEVLASQQQATAAGQALAEAQAAHGRAVETAATRLGTAMQALKAEQLSAAEIAELTGVEAAEVRRALRAAPVASPAEQPSTGELARA